MADPFGPENSSKKRNYLLLVSASKETATVVRGILHRLKENVDMNADTTWIDSKGLGVMFSTDMVGYDIWDAILEEKRVDFENIKDVMIVELGRDWIARTDSKPDHWLSTHVGRPLPRPSRARR